MPKPPAEFSALKEELRAIGISPDLLDFVETKITRKTEQAKPKKLSDAARSRSSPKTEDFDEVLQKPFAPDELGRVQRNAETGDESAKRILTLLRAAQGGNTDAAFYLGHALVNASFGLNRDPQKAAEWFRIAARGGHPKSQRELGHLYEIGDGVAKDLPAAKAWYEKASSAGDEIALRALDAFNCSDVVESAKTLREEELQLIRRIPAHTRKAIEHPTFPTEELLAVGLGLPSRFGDVLREVIRHPPTPAIQRFGETLTRTFDTASSPEIVNIWAHFIQPFLAQDKKGLKTFISSAFAVEPASMTTAEFRRSLDSRVKEAKDDRELLNKVGKSGIEEFLSKSKEVGNNLNAAVTAILRFAKADAAPAMCLVFGVAQLTEALSNAFSHRLREVALWSTLGAYTDQLSSSLSELDLVSSKSTGSLAALGAVAAAHLDLIDTISCFYEWESSARDDEQWKPLQYVWSDRRKVADSAKYADPWDQGEQAFNNGEYEKARGIWLRAAKSAPQYWPYNSIVAYQLGLANHNLRKYTEAIRYYETAIRKAYDLPYADINLANIFLDKGNTQKAMEYASESAKLWPDSDEAHEVLGRVLDAAGEKEPARQEFEEAKRLQTVGEGG